ncbi:MAG: NAD synthetase, partial [Pseudomonadales bacterium]|nr:NAD synthetase [Pseudomonadales bacterium]
MSTEIIINLVYVASAVLFIFGLKLLGSPDTARRGNLISASGMFIAVLVTLLDQQIVDYQHIALGIVLG